MSAFGGVVDELHDQLQHFLGGLCRLALSHSTPEIRGGKNAGPWCRRRVANFGQIPFRLPLSASDQRAGVPGNHQILVGLDHIGSDAVTGRADLLFMFSVGRFVQLQPQPRTGGADFAAYRRRVLADRR